MSDELCPFCGAYSVRKCEFDGIDEGAECPWQIALDEEESLIDYRVEDARELRSKP